MSEVRLEDLLATAVRIDDLESELARLREENEALRHGLIRLNASAEHFLLSFGNVNSSVPDGALLKRLRIACHEAMLVLHKPAGEASRRLLSGEGGGG